jgi:disulfide bond formation protein DsbB
MAAPRASHAAAGPADGGGLLKLRERPALLFVCAAVASLAAVGAALVSQHVYGIQPCPWCVLQRLIFVVVAAVALLGLLAERGSVWQRVAGGAMSLVAIEGMVAALWQHFVAAASASCNLTFADRVMTGLHLDTLLPEIFEARATCADAAVRLLGVPYEFYSLALFALLCVAGVLVLTQPTRSR